MSEITIEGIVTAIVFSNVENGYSVLRLDTGASIVTLTGVIPGVSPGERLKATGAWTNHPQYGEQFNIDTFEVVPPSGIDEIYRYLASGAIKGIGPAKARDIVEEFGSDAIAAIENDPEKLAKIKGISLKSARKIGEGIRRQAGLRRLIDFFQHYGIAPAAAIQVYKFYGDEAIDAVRDDPYIIASSTCGVDFSSADAIAIELGFESDHPKRVSAALLFELRHNLGNGHTFIPEDKLIAATMDLIGVERDVVEEALEALCECGEIVCEAIAGVEGCYLRYIHDAESYIVRRLNEMAAPQANDLHVTSGTIRGIEQSNGIKYADMQIAALELAAKNGVMALTGGPGTGKTTTILGILMLYDAMGLKTSLCAPTGRAAKRLSEICHREASTIHRLLGVAPGIDGELVFDHDEIDPLDADAVIVDESSMIDVIIMHSLLLAMKRGSRLIMVGDIDQLPPIGPGNVFSDIIRSDSIPNVSLKEIFRQANDSGIVNCAHSVNKGVMPDLSARYPDLYFLRRQSDEQLAETVAELYGQRLPANMGIDPSQIQILTPTRKHPAGTVMLNELLRETVNPRQPHKKEKMLGDSLFRVGDKVMQIRNNYDIIWKSSDGSYEGTGVFNGDVGVIKDMDLERETITVEFEDKLVAYIFEQHTELEPAFAMTIHKSQGSEYHAVVLALTAAAPQLLTRSVLYTAMTRARNLLVIVGRPDVMARMVENDRRQKRYSGLRARLAAR